MESIKACGYEVIFGEKSYDTLNSFIAQKNYSGIYILVDSNSNENCLLRFLSFLATDIKIEIIEIEAGEPEKNINTCVEIWSVLTDLGADRKSLMINIGGGVITDLGGFVASTFKRGIDFINIPTTLLSMVDASIGGKTGVDLGNLKNQIGVINNPKMVIIDSEYLSTLPQQQMRSGLAEILKHGLIYDKKYWSKFTDLSQIDYADFDALIHRSIEIKNEIVLHDPTEKGARKALNFGHTLGHAIESYFLENENRTNLLHGEAIAVGMILEAFISKGMNYISEAEYLEIKNTINAVFDTVKFEKNDIEPILELLIHDKKNEHGKIQFTLLYGIGNFKINQQVDKALILKSFEDYQT